MADLHPVCPADELGPGDVEIVEVNDQEIGVFNVDGEYYALHNLCPHRGGPVCEGRIVGLVSSDEPGSLTVEREGEILRCPWHSWEYDITTGELVLDPEELRTRTYDVSIEPLHADDLEDVALETFDVEVDDEFVFVRA